MFFTFKLSVNIPQYREQTLLLYFTDYLVINHILNILRRCRKTLCCTGLWNRPKQVGNEKVTKSLNWVYPFPLFMNYLEGGFTNIFMQIFRPLLQKFWNLVRIVSFTFLVVNFIRLRILKSMSGSHQKFSLTDHKTKLIKSIWVHSKKKQKKMQLRHPTSLMY